MPEYRCPFSAVLAAGSCHCQHAHEVVRRGGSEFDCHEPAVHAACAELTRHLHATALPALGYEDDLTQTPKSIYERILLGGLQGLRVAENKQDTELQTANIATVVKTALQKYASLSNIPVNDIIPAIESCSIRKRQHKQRKV